MSATGKKKRRNSGAEPHKHEEELWLISYADMMTLLFGFFVILYSFSTLDEKKFSKVSEQMAEALGKKDKAKADQTQMLSDEDERLRFMTLLVSMMNMGSVDDLMAKVQKKADRDAALDAARAALDEGDADDKTKALELVLPSDGLFDATGATLTPAGKVKLKEIAGRIGRVKDLVDVEIESHTDGRPPGANRTYKSNWALSSARAGAVAEALTGFGIDPGKLKIKGYGSARPLFPEKTAAGVPIDKNRARNRRIQIVLSRSGEGA